MTWRMVVGKRVCRVSRIDLTSVMLRERARAGPSKQNAFGCTSAGRKTFLLKSRGGGD